MASDKGWRNIDARSVQLATIFICPQCGCPTLYIPSVGHWPPALPARQVSELPKDVGALYDEARECVACGAFTAAVLVCRKLLMNVAVSEGADPNNGFVQFVDFLVANSYVPPKAKQWVDYIRRRGNEANHEIQLMSRADAEALLTFMEMLLRLVYEFPASVPTQDS